MSDQRKIYVYVHTGYANASHEDWHDLPEGWDDMTDEERKAELDDWAEVALSNHIEAGAFVVARSGETEACEE
jgi:hypothetical protein